VWGFRPVLPPNPCTGATIALLGADTCQPIDDCASGFPPPDAKIVVRASASPYPDRPELPVVATLDDALASVPPGATIAVDEGEFALPAAIATPAHIVGRCAEKTSLRGADFGVSVASAVDVTLTSLALTGAPKCALLINHHAKVALDRVHIRGDGDAAEVGNGATMTVTRSVFEGPPVPSPVAPSSTGIQAIYGGIISMSETEVRGYQLSLFAQSAKTRMALSKSVVHEERAFAEREALSQIGAFLGAQVTIDQSHVESAPGRIAMVGAALLDREKDLTSPGDPPASLTVTNGTLLHALIPRETGSAIDTVHGASVALDNVSMRHDCFVGLSTSESATVSLKNSVIQTNPSAVNARIALSGLTRGSFTVDSSAILGAAQFAVLLDSGSQASMSNSLVSGNHEIGIGDFTAFMGAAQAVAVNRGGQATIADTAFVDNEDVALRPGGTAEVEGAVFSGTTASSFGPFSAAITGVDATLTVHASSLAKNDRAVALRGGRALLRESTVTDHKEALRLDGVSLQQTTDDVENAVDAKLVASRTTFARNLVLVSAKSLTDE
jgi:hypothetical protein